MHNNKKVFVVMPAYNAEKTLIQTYSEIDFSVVDEVVLVDDYSIDETSLVSHNLGIKHYFRHDKNKGYGANQKTCYNKALELGADIIIMIHPDYQYTPKLIPAMVSLIGSGLYDVVFASRILGNGAIKGGMPIYKYVSNRILTLIQNFLFGQKLSEYHTGYRAYSKELLQSINYNDNSNDFIFDNEIIAQIFDKDFEIAEITCPTRYLSDSSSINFSRSIVYGLGVLKVSCLYFLHKTKFIKWRKLTR